MKYPDYEIDNIKNFFDACNEMIEGRFILSDIKISKILKAIAGSEVLYNLFAEALNHFKFNDEFELAKSNTKIDGGYFVLPEGNNKKLALVFCILLEVDKQKLNLQNFVNDYFFSNDGYNVAYSNFAINVLEPFKLAVMQKLGCNEDGESVEFDNEEDDFDSNNDSYEDDIVAKELEPDSKQQILFSNLKMSLKELLSVILKSKIKDEQKEELKIIINAMFEAIDLKNLTIIYALSIPLEYMIGKNKNVKFYYNDFKECLVQFY